MIFWLVAAVMTAIALAIVLAPLTLRQRRAPKRVEYDLTIYRDQLHELESDRALGLVNAEQSEAARLEIQRRMLAATKRDKAETEKENTDEAKPSPLNKKVRWFSNGSLGAAIPALAVALYFTLGSPGTPGRPFTGVAQQGGTASQDMAGQSIDDAILNLAQRLEQNPNNLDGWLLLGRSLITLERYDEAAQALSAAVTLSKGDPDIVGSMAEVMVFAADGIVTGEALAAFETVLGTRPNDPAAQYYIGMSLAQQGRPAEALDIWQKLATETPANAPWRADLVTLMRRAASETGIELGLIASAPAASNVADSGVGASGPNQEDIAAAAEMNPEERMEMIRAMVDRLATRLESEPDDLEGWRRLANAYRVLGEDARAAAAEQRVGELQSSAAMGSADNPAPPDHENMLARLANEVRENPDDVQNWLRLGRAYSVLERHGEARDAYAWAAQLAPNDIKILSFYARAVMNAAGESHQFPDQAIDIFRRILALDADHPEALWFMGFAEASRDQTRKAREYWTRLRDRLPKGSEDHEAVVEALKELQNGQGQ